MKRLFAFIGLLFLAALTGTTSWAASYYLAPVASGGSDSNECTSALPCHSSTKTLSLMSRGDETVWKSGTYGVNDKASRLNTPSLPADNGLEITFRGESFGDVIFTSHTAFDVTGSTRLVVSDIVIKNVYDGHAIYGVNITSCSFKRIGIKNGAEWDEQFANVIDIGGTSGVGSKYNLFEDIAIIGVFRYGLMIGGSAGFSEFNILRRVLTRFDGSNSVEPKAGISNYGATTGIDGARNNLIQNCIAIDYNLADNGSGEGVYGGFYNPHSASNIDNVASIALNLPQRAYLLQEDSDSGYSDLLYSVAWNVGRLSNTDAIYLDEGVGNNRSVISHVTVSSVTGSGSRGIGQYGTSGFNVTNSMFRQTNTVNSTTATYSHYSNATVPGGDANSTSGAITFDCMVKVPDGTAADGSASDSGDRGATIIYKLGTDGALYGETGFNTLTSDSLWPWPYEDVIHDLAAEADSGEWATDMSANLETRGFAASTWTLTEYIDDYITDDGCGFAAASDPDPVPTFDVDVDTTVVSEERIGIFGGAGGIFASTVTLSQELAAIDAAGGGIFRMNMDQWSYIWRSTNLWDWSMMDATVATVTGTATGQWNKEFLATIPIASTWTPAFNNAVATDPILGVSVPRTHFPTLNIAQFETFVSSFTTRYKDSIKYYQIYNEPDFSFYWNGVLCPSATEYAVYLQTAAAVIRSIDSDGQIVTGGLAFASDGVPGCTYTGGSYLQALLTAGATESFDILDFHFYPDALGTDDLNVAITSLTVQMQAHGVTNPRIWISETAKFGGNYPTSNIETEEVGKSSWVYRGFSLALSTGIERTFYHSLRLNDFSLLTNSFAERYAYKSLQKFYQRLNGLTIYGDTGSGNLRAFKFEGGGRRVYVTWCEAASCTWTPTPTPIFSRKIDIYAQSTDIPGSQLQSYSIGREPAIYEEFAPTVGISGFDSIRGFTFR